MLSEPLNPGSNKQERYIFPWDRKKMRHVRGYAERGRTEVLSELYDFLIIFNRPEDVGVKEEDVEVERVSWKDIEQAWFQAVPGDEDAKNRGVKWLRNEWLSRFRTDTVSSEMGGDTIPRATFESLAREHIVDALSRKAGLQLKLAPTQNTQIYCLVRAPPSLLEKKADQMKYKLGFRGQVDPGVSFWQRKEGHDDRNQPRYVELIEEAQLYSKNQANEILEDLYAAHKISANDAAVFETDEPTKKHWSRRIHTLERIADKVPVTNRFPAYAEFSRAPHLRHLYDEYHTNRGPTLLKPKDRLYVTKRILDEQFDFGVLVEKNIVCACFALHDASRGDPITRDWLLEHWVFAAFSFHGGASEQMGAPFVSHPSVEIGVICPIYLRPWAQPLLEVRDYFGEKIALYFAWVGFYGYSLLKPALAALACEFYLLVTSSSDESSGIHIDQLLLAIFIVVWAASYKEYWDVESKFCAVKWGTLNFEEDEVDRPQFKGDESQPRRLSPVTYEHETYYPEDKRTATQIISSFAVLCCVGLLLISVVALFEVQFLVFELGVTGTRPLSELFPILQSILIQVGSWAYGNFAEYLNETENYRTETAFENNLIIKKFFFEIFNNFSALAITAYVKDVYFVCTFGSCLDDTKFLLIAIVATRYAIALYGVLGNGLVGIVTARRNDANGEKVVSNPLRRRDDDDDDEIDIFYDDSAPSRRPHQNPTIGQDGDGQPELDDEFFQELELGGLQTGPNANLADARKAFQELEQPKFEEEVALADYEGTFDDYAEIVLQMGLVSMFSLGWYLLPACAMLETLLQIRVDAYRLCSMTRRPDPNLAESVGSWGGLMEAMGLLACFTNAGLIVYTGGSFKGRKYTANGKLLYFFAFEHVLLAAKFLTHLLVESDPEALKEIRKRQTFVVDRHKNVVFGDDDFLDDDDLDDVVAEPPQPQDKEAPPAVDTRKRGHVDRDGLKTAFVKGATLGAVELAQLAYLRQRQEDCHADRKIAEGEYKRAAKTEVLNEELGVSYSRRNPDLALGMVTLTILEAENVGTRRDPVDAKNCRVVVLVRDTTPIPQRKYQGQPGPAPQVSKAARLPPKDVSSETISSGQRLVFNQAFTLAPIKTAKAEVAIDIVDQRNRRKLGTATLVLTDLANQERRSLTLSVLRSTPQSDTDPAAVLYVKAQFQYSKLIPIKRRIYSIIEEQRRITRDIQNIQLGHPYEHNWDFPDGANPLRSQGSNHDDDGDNTPGGGL